MIFLLLQIVFSSAFTLLIKWAQVRGREDVIAIGAINYVVAALAILPLFFFGDRPPFSLDAILTGGSMGMIYFIAFFFVNFAIRTVGASTTTVVGVLSIMLPIVFSAYHWDEIPAQSQAVGVGLAILSLSLIGGQTNRKALEDSTGKKWIVPLVLVSFFLLCGLSRLSQEAFKHLCNPEQRPTFLIAAFGVAAIPSFLILVGRRKKLLPAEIGIGFGLGIANVLQTFFILTALHYFPGYVVFPVSSAGGILLTTIVATGLLGERISRRTQLGIAFSVVALFLLYG